MLDLSVTLLLHFSYFPIYRSVSVLSRHSPKVKNFIAFLALTLPFKITNIVLAHMLHILNKVAEAGHGLGVEVIRWCYRCLLSFSLHDS